MSATALRVGVAQMFNRRTLNENLDQTLKMIGEVKAKGCDVVVFAENNLRDLEHASVADFDVAVEAVKKRARECEINVVVGVSAQVISKNHNQALVVNRLGEEILRYQKNNEVPQRVWIDGIPCSVAICSDRWYLEHADLACLTQGSQVMIDISGGHGGDDGRPHLQWVRYRCWAIRNSTFVVVCNLPHDDEPDYMGHDVWGGHSAILDPKGQFLAKAGYEKDVILTADLNVNLATREHAEFRRNHPVFKKWWDMGKVVLEGDDVDAPPFTPLPSPERKMKIAAAQVICGGNLQTQVTRVREAIGQAKVNGARVVAFPERMLVGEDVNALMRALDDVADSVRENDLYAILGVSFPENGQVFNSAIVFNPQGEQITRYNQISARGEFLAGQSTRSMWFDVDGVHATVTVGNDLYWPELTELAAYRGSQLHFHLDQWLGDSDDANLVRTQSAITHLAPAIAGVWVNGCGDGASGGSLLCKRVGGHGQPIPDDVEAYLPYYTSVMQSAGVGENMLTFTVETGEYNTWQASRNRTRQKGRGHENWWKWVCQGVNAIY